MRVWCRKSNLDIGRDVLHVAPEGAGPRFYWIRLTPTHQRCIRTYTRQGREGMNIRVWQNLRFPLILLSSVELVSSYHYCVAKFYDLVYVIRHIHIHIPSK